MLSDEKILITGASGLVGREFAKALAPHNEVWGLSRYAASREGEINAWAVSREETEKMGVKTFAANLLGDLTGLPDDFTYVLHFAHTRLPAEQLYEAVAINSVGPGWVLQHCRKAKAALVVSSTAVYSWPTDPDFAADERADLCRGAGPSFNPTSAASKLSLEAVSRFCANIFELPVTIMRLNVPYGPNSGMPIRDMDAIATGRPLMHGLLEPFPNTPIHFDDMIDQVEALLDAAST